MKVYGHPMSTCTRKVLTTLAEKQHRAELVVVELGKGEHKQPAHLARHPFGVIPVLEDDDGFTMYESRAIMRYLDVRLPGAALTPAALHARGRMEQWISVEQSYFTPAAMKIIHQLYFGRMRGQEPDMKVVEQGRGEVARVLDVIEKPLGEQQYLAGDAFSLAEISWMPYIEYLHAAGAGDLFNARPHARAWWERIRARPSWQKVTGAGAAR